MKRLYSVLGVIVVFGLLAQVPAAAGTLSIRRKAIFGDEIPVISIVSDSIGIGGEMGRLGRARHTFVRKLFDAGFVVHLNGRGLSVAADLYDQYAAAVKADNFLWKVALVMQGSNDFALSRTLADTTTGYASFLDDVMSSPVYGLRGQSLVCVMPLQRFDEDTPNEEGYVLEDYRVAIREVCSARGLPVWEGEQILPPDLRISDWKPSTYFNDGIHPNRKGHKLMARSIADLILTYYERLSPAPTPAE